METRNERIIRMEALYDEASSLLKDLKEALERYEEAGETFRTLSAYLENGWKKDYEADERGKIPRDIKRGVLSQDGLYNLLEKEIELKERLGL